MLVLMLAVLTVILVQLNRYECAARARPAAGAERA